MSATDVIPFLWFDDDLEDAVASYGRIFGDLRRDRDQADPHTGKLLATRFEIAGRKIMALQGGPGHPHTDAMSLYVLVEGGQSEVDRIWDGFLADGGSEVACGWLTDAFGVSWQIVPVEFEAAVLDPDPARATAAFDAMMKMTRIVIADLPAPA